MRRLSDGHVDGVEASTLRVKANLYRRRNAPKTSACSRAAFSKAPRNESWPSRLDLSSASSSATPKMSGFAASADLSGLSLGKGFFPEPVRALADARRSAACALLTCIVNDNVLCCWLSVFLSGWRFTRALGARRDARGCDEAVESVRQVCDDVCGRRWLVSAILTGERAGTQVRPAQR